MSKPRPPQSELTATVTRILYSAPDGGDFRILAITYPHTETDPNNPNKTKTSNVESCCKGNDYNNDLTPGLTYRFLGRWEDHPKYGRQFSFNQFIKEIPLERTGVVKYLAKYAPGIGPAIANRLFDQWGANAIRVLRNCPEDAATIKGLTLEKAIEAAAALKELQQFEETRVELNQLLSGRGFSHSLGEILIKRWGIMAPGIIRHDPFKLLVNGFPTCGFNRCNEMYLAMGLPEGRIKRQMLCLWHVMHKSMDHTWYGLDFLDYQLKKSIESAEPQLVKALKLGVRSKWIAVRNDDQGKPWFAEKKKAENEGVIARVVGGMLTIKSDEDESPDPTESDESEPESIPSPNGHSPGLAEFFKGNATHVGDDSERMKFDDRKESRPDVRFAGVSEI